MTSSQPISPLCSATSGVYRRARPWHGNPGRTAVCLALCTSVLMTGCRLAIDPDDYAALDGGSQPMGEDGRLPPMGADGGTSSTCGDPPLPATACYNNWAPLYPSASCDVVESSAPLALTDGTYTLNTDTAIGAGGTVTLTHDNGRPEDVRALIYRQTAGNCGEEYDVEALVLTVASLDISPFVTLRAIGSRPLFIVSRTTISVAGAIDVSSDTSGLTEPILGAGHDPDVYCSEAERMAADGMGIGNGGGGGGFGTAGGNGGGSDNAIGGIGMAARNLPLPVIMGGCRGGKGGHDMLQGAPGGSGGGAIALIAYESIALVGNGREQQINASGAGGGGGRAGGAGAGGGSGGLILLDAPSVTLRADSFLIATGGGGGGNSLVDPIMGGNALPGGDGDDGSDRLSSGGEAPLTLIGDGGDGGGFQLEDPGEPGEPGGGGGGGGGYILIHAASLSDQGVSMTPQAQCLDQQGTFVPCFQ